jgi:Zn-dependent M28 family amino/carboxypeptidase
MSDNTYHATPGGYQDMTMQPVLLPLSTVECDHKAHLQRHVHVLASQIGGRSYQISGSLALAAEYVEQQLRSSAYKPARQDYQVAGDTFTNIAAGSEEGSIVVGAHYDTAGGLPGANDNGSGVAAVLELARAFAGSDEARKIRWLLFVNEEPPWFQSSAMGSLVYARRCRANRERITAMLSLETIGYYSTEPGSQQYPVGFHPGYPDRGDFLGFVSDLRSSGILRRALHAFRSATSLPAQGAAAPALVPGISWSDHWSFWQCGYRALMVTDTAPYRYPWYHTAGDTPEKLDYERMARALTGLAAVIRELARD